MSPVNVTFLGGTHQLQRTMHSRVLPSTLQVMVVVPRPTGFTAPSAEMVATEVLPMLQVGVEEVPLTFIYTVGSLALLKVKSVWLRERLPEEVLLPDEVLLPEEELLLPEVVPLVTPLRTRQV